MLPYRDSRITTIAIVVFFVLVLGYAYFEARGLLYGPRITVSSGTTEVHDPFIQIKGTADRISSLSMNGKQINVTEGGVFDEPYLLSPGLNRIVLDATDKYGRRRSQVVQIVYTPLSTDSTPSTSSGQASSPQATTSTSTPPVAQ
ncbi:MAG: hypothetical protein AAB480_01640 [Patescibacteria group bacterium]